MGIDAGRSDMRSTTGGGSRERMREVAEESERWRKKSEENEQLVREQEEVTRAVVR